MKKRALISVSDKTGVVELAMRLGKQGFEIISTGGTFKLLSESGVDAIPAEDITGFAECMDGRIKTLHPNVHGGILFERGNESHVEDMKRNNIEPIDIVVVNLYPFSNVYHDASSTHRDKIENIDIGGPTMVRAAAKNYSGVVILTDPCDYEKVCLAVESGRNEEGYVHGVSAEMRLMLAKKAFAMTAGYDTLISKYLVEALGDFAQEASEDSLPEAITLRLEKVSDLRYGENPQQKAGVYADSFEGRGKSGGEGVCLLNAKKLHGKELSFNNYLDMNAAVAMVAEFSESACVGVKHNNPCGVGIGNGSKEAWVKAYEGDKTSIFGGVVAFNDEVGEDAAELLGQLFLEIIVAPSFSDKAFEILSRKKNIRLVELDPRAGKSASSFEIKTIQGGYLVQGNDWTSEQVSDFKVVTEKAPTDDELKNLSYALRMAKHVKSNAIVIFKDGQMIGVGGGQTSRVWALENALERSGFDLNGAVVASDGFFPFKDCVEIAAKYGISAIVQPGGSMNDQDSVDTANELGVSMVLTGVRHFKH